MKISISGKAYNKGKMDGFMDNPQNYDIKEKDYIWIKDKMDDYIKGYDKGYQHGAGLRNRFIEENGFFPISIDDLIKFQEKLKVRYKTSDEYVNDVEKKNAETENISERKSLIAATEVEIGKRVNEIKELISKGLIKRAIKHARVLYEGIEHKQKAKNCIYLESRLSVLRDRKRSNLISEEAAGLEFSIIVNSLLETLLD